MTAFFRGNDIAVPMPQNDLPSHLSVCGGKLENTVALLAENAVRKESTHRRQKILSGTFPEMDYLGLANNPIGTECVFAFEKR